MVLGVSLRNRPGGPGVARSRRCRRDGRWLTSLPLQIAATDGRPVGVSPGRARPCWPPPQGPWLWLSWPSGPCRTWPGPAFVQVSALVAPRGSATGPTITVAGLAPVQATALDVGVEVVNRYPLIGRRRHRRAGLPGRRLPARPDGQLARGLADERGRSGARGGLRLTGRRRVGRAAPRSCRRARRATTSRARRPGFSLVDATGAPLAAGVYYLRVWAYGIASALVPIALDAGADPLGPLRPFCPTPTGS